MTNVNKTLYSAFHNGVIKCFMTSKYVGKIFQTHYNLNTGKQNRSNKQASVTSAQYQHSVQFTVIEDKKKINKSCPNPVLCS